MDFFVAAIHRAMDSKFFAQRSIVQRGCNVYYAPALFKLAHYRHARLGLCGNSAAAKAHMNRSRRHARVSSANSGLLMTPAPLTPARDGRSASPRRARRRVFWITDVFPAVRDRERPEADLKAYLKGQRRTCRRRRACPTRKDDKVEVVRARNAQASEFHHKLGDTLHEVFAPEFDPRR